MKIEDTTAPTDIRSAFCRFCQKDRFKHEMKTMKGPSGRIIKRCTHCLAFNKPQTQKSS